MHLETLAPLLSYWPLLLLAGAAIVLLPAVQLLRARGKKSAWQDYERRYWAGEQAYRARMRLRSLLFGRRTLRLTHSRSKDGQPD